MKTIKLNQKYAFLQLLLLIATFISLTLSVAFSPYKVTFASKEDPFAPEIVMGFEKIPDIDRYVAEGNGAISRYTVKLSAPASANVKFRLAYEREILQTTENNFVLEPQNYLRASEEYTIPTGQTSVEVSVKQTDDSESQSGLRCSLITPEIISAPQNVGVYADFEKGITYSLRHYVFDTDGQNGLIFFSPEDVAENENYLDIDFIRYGDNNAINKSASFAYKIGDNYAQGNAVKAETRFENYNSLYILNVSNGEYEYKNKLRIRIIDNDEIDYTQLFSVTFTNFNDCGNELITTGDDKYSTEEGAVITCALLDDEYENLDKSLYEFVKVGSNVNYGQGNEFTLAEKHNSTDSLVLELATVDEFNLPVVAKEDINLIYEIISADAVYGEDFTVDGYDAVNCRGEITIAKDQSGAQIKITTINNSVSDGDRNFHISFRVNGRSDILFAQNLSVIKGIIVDDDEPFDNNAVWIDRFFTYDDGIKEITETITLEKTGRIIDPLIKAEVALNSDYTGDLPWTAYVEFVDGTAKLGKEFFVSSRVTGVGNVENIAFTLDTRYFSGYKEFTIRVKNVGLPDGLNLSETNATEITVRLKGLLTEKVAVIDGAEYTADKGGVFAVELKRFEPSVSTNYLDVKNYGSISMTEGEHYAQDLFPIRVDWAENELSKTVYISTVDNRTFENMGGMLTFTNELFITDSEKEPYKKFMNGDTADASDYVPEGNFNSVLNLNENYDGGVFYFVDSVAGVFMGKGDRIVTVNRYYAETDSVTTLTYRIYEYSDEELIAFGLTAQDKAKDGVDFIAESKTITVSGSENAEITVRMPEVLTNYPKIRYFGIELLDTSENALICGEKASVTTGNNTKIQIGLSINSNNFFMPLQFETRDGNGNFYTGVTADSGNSSTDSSITIDLSGGSANMKIAEYAHNSSFTSKARTTVYFFSKENLFEQGVSLYINDKKLSQFSATADLIEVYKTKNHETNLLYDADEFLYMYSCALDVEVNGKFDFRIEKGNISPDFRLFPMVDGQSGLSNGSDCNTYVRNIVTDTYTGSMSYEPQAIVETGIKIVYYGQEIGYSIPEGYYGMKVVFNREYNGSDGNLYVKLSGAELNKDYEVVQINSTEFTLNYSHGAVSKEVIINALRNGYPYSDKVLTVSLYDSDEANAEPIYVKEIILTNTEEEGQMSVKIGELIYEAIDMYPYGFDYKTYVPVYITNENAGYFDENLILCVSRPSSLTDYDAAFAKSKYYYDAQFSSNGNNHVYYEDEFGEYYTYNFNYSERVVWLRLETKSYADKTWQIVILGENDRKLASTEFMVHSPTRPMETVVEVDGVQTLNYGYYNSNGKARPLFNGTTGYNEILPVSGELGNGNSYSITNLALILNKNGTEYVKTLPYAFSRSNLQLVDTDSDGVKEIIIYCLNVELPKDVGNGNYGSGVFIINIMESNPLLVKTAIKIDAGKRGGYNFFDYGDLDNDGKTDFIWYRSETIGINVAEMQDAPEASVYFACDGYKRAEISMITGSDEKVAAMSIKPSSEDECTRLAVYYLTGEFDRNGFNVTEKDIIFGNAENSINISVENRTVKEGEEVVIKIKKFSAQTSSVRIELGLNNVIMGLSIANVFPIDIFMAETENYKEYRIKVYDDGVMKDGLYFTLDFASSILPSGKSIRIDIENATTKQGAPIYSFTDKVTRETPLPEVITGEKFFVDFGYIDYRCAEILTSLECKTRVILRAANNFNHDFIEAEGSKIYVENFDNDANYVGYILIVERAFIYDGSDYYKDSFEIDYVNAEAYDAPEYIVTLPASGFVSEELNLNVNVFESKNNMDLTVEITLPSGETRNYKADESGSLSTQLPTPALRGDYTYVLKIINETLNSEWRIEKNVTVYGGTVPVGVRTVFAQNPEESCSVLIKITGIDVNYKFNGKTDSEEGVAALELKCGKTYRFEANVGTDANSGIISQSREVLITNSEQIVQFELLLGTPKYANAFVCIVDYEHFKTMFDDMLTRIDHVVYDDRIGFNSVYTYASLSDYKNATLKNRERDMAWSLLNAKKDSDGNSNYDKLVYSLTGKTSNQLLSLGCNYNRIKGVIRSFQEYFVKHYQDYIVYGISENMYFSSVPPVPEFVECEADEIIITVVVTDNFEDLVIKTNHGEHNENSIVNSEIMYDGSNIWTVDSFEVNNTTRNLFANCFIMLNASEVVTLRLADVGIYEDASREVVLFHTGNGMGEIFVNNISETMAGIQSIKIPDNIGVPLIAGYEFSLGIGDYADMAIEVDNVENTITVKIGVSVDTDGDMEDNEFLQAMRNNRCGFIKTGPDVGAEMGFGGKIVFKYSDEEGGYIVDHGEVYICAEIRVGYTFFLALPVVHIPVYFTSSISFSASTTLTINWDDVKHKIYVGGEAELGVRVEIEAGIGIPGVLSAGIYGGADVTINLRYGRNYDANNDCTLTLGIDCGVKIQVLFWKKDIQIARKEWTWNLSNSTSLSASVRSMAYSSKLGDFINKNECSGIAFITNANDEILMCYSLNAMGEYEQQIFIENVSEQAAPTLLQRADGAKMIFWINRDVNRGLNNEEVLNYVYYDGCAWSEIGVVDNTNTADTAFVPMLLDGKFAVVYHDINNLGANATMSERLLSTEVALSIFDDAEETFTKTRLTENGYNEINTYASSDGENAVIIVYETRNVNINDDMTVNDYLAGENAQNYVLLSVYNKENGSFGEFTVIYDDGMPPIVSADIKLIGNSLHMLAVIDVDCDLVTVSDREVMLFKYDIESGYGEQERLTDNGNRESAPKIVELDGKPVYMYINEYNLTYVIDGEFYDGGIISDADLEEISAFSSDDYIAITWAQADEEGKQQIYISLLDKTHKIFSKPFKATTSDKLSRNGIVSFDADGNGALIYFIDDEYIGLFDDGSEGEYEYNSQFKVNSSMAYTRFEFDGGLVLDGIEFNHNDLYPNEVGIFNLTLTNDCILASDTASVKVFRDGNEVLTKDLGQVLKGGETYSFDIEVLLTGAVEELTFVLYGNGVECGRNTVKVLLSNIAVRNIVVGSVENGYEVKVSIENIGNITAENVRVFASTYYDITDVLSEQTIALLEVGERAVITLTFGFDDVEYNARKLGWFKVYAYQDGATKDTLAEVDFDTTDNIKENYASREVSSNAFGVDSNALTIGIGEEVSLGLVYVGLIPDLESDNESIATISGDTVMGIAVGRANIVISNGNSTLLVGVTVGVKPELRLNGGAVTLSQGSEYLEQGAALYKENVEINGEITVSGLVNNQVVGRYTIRYVYNENGIYLCAVRTVTVVPKSVVATVKGSLVSGGTVTGSNVVLYDEDGKTVKTVVATDGKFNFSNIADGKYYLSSSFNGIESERIAVEVGKVVNPTYAVTVTNGTGGGEYAESETVTITAEIAPNGKKFKCWTGDGVTFADANSATTTFTMPAKSVTITAVYEDVATKKGGCGGSIGASEIGLSLCLFIAVAFLARLCYVKKSKCE